MSFKLFLPDQTECTDLNHFISCYNQVYFYDKNTSIVTEHLIDNLLNQSKLEKKDVFNILAWKIDGIDNNATISLDDIRYKRKWKIENDKFFGDNIWHEIKMDKVIACISENSEKWLAHWDNKDFGYDPEFAQEVVTKILNTANEQPCSYIGEVYIITLLYFVTKGRWPIYDQFASIAMKAMNSKGMRPYDTIKDTKLPEKTSAKFSQFITTNGVYSEYIEFIKKIQLESNYQYYTSRYIDRALWAYGHTIKNWYKVKENAEK